MLLLAVLAAGCGSAKPVAHTASAQSAPSAPVVLHGLPVVDPVAPDFALPDQSGHIVRLSAERGDAVLVTFLYTDCQDVCPVIAAKLSQVARRLPAGERRRLRILAVSVDPAHDTRAAVRAFIRRLSLPPQFHYLTGTPDQLRPVWQGYNLTVDVKNVEIVNHSAYVLLLDPHGTPRLYYRPTFGVRFLVRDVARVLARG
jgi:protein SCO1/2